MPYRRLPKTDATRLRSLKTILDNNSLYTANNNFIEWKTLNDASTMYDRLLMVVEQMNMTLYARHRVIARGSK